MATSGSFTAVSASWVVPTPTGDGTDTTADATWIGIGGVTSGDLIQTGTDNSVSKNGTVSTEAFYEMLPAVSQTVPGVTVLPGNSISASITEVAAGQWEITITNNTNDETYSSTVSYTSSNSSAEWIEEDPSYTNGQLVPFDDFGTVSISGASMVVGGTTESIATGQGSSITMVDSYGKAIATPSSVTGGSAFSVTRD